MIGAGFVGVYSLPLTFERLGPQCRLQLIEDGGHGEGGIEVAQDDQQELGLGPEEGQEDLVAALAGHDRIHLGGDAVGELGEKGLVIVEGAIDPAGMVDLEGALAPGQFAPDLSGVVEVSGLE